MLAEKQRLTFISYSRADKEFALELAKELREAGFSIWLDQLDIPAGARWDDEIEKALDKCDIFMVILTPNSAASNNVKDEIGYAVDCNKRILPILLENAKLPIRLRRFQYVNFTHISHDEGIEEARRLLKELVEEPASLGPERADLPQSQRRTEGAEDSVAADAKREQLARKRAEAIRLAREREQRERQSQPKPITPVNKEAPKGNLQKQPTMRWMLLAGGAAVILFSCLAIGPSLGRGIFLPPVTVGPVIATSTPTSTIPAVSPTATFTPNPSPTFTPTFITPVEPAPVRSSPEQFIRDYFDNINKRDYVLTWSMLTNQFQMKANKGDFDSYKAGWDTYTEVKLTDVRYTYLSDLAAFVSLKPTFVKGGRSISSRVTFYLARRTSQEGWLIDSRPEVVGSPSNSCSMSPKGLEVNKTAEVVTKKELGWRDAPAGARMSQALPPDSIVTVLEGPICEKYGALYFWWWKVQSPSGDIGWVVEGSDETDLIFIVPVR